MHYSCPKITASVVVLLLVAVVSVAAHDFWLVPDAFQIAPGEELNVRGQTSSAFPTSESAIALDRVQEAQLVGPDGVEQITDLSHRDQSLALRYRPRAVGQRIVAAWIRWRYVPESAAGFRQWMVLEGAPEALARYERTGQLPTDSIVRRYAKYAKTVVEVGSGGRRAYHLVVGHPLEFVPLTDPHEQSVGGLFRVRLLFQGTPLADARVRAGVAPAVGADREPDAEFSTTANGVVEVPVNTVGLWNVRTLHIVPAGEDADADWDVHWATFVFQVRGD